MKKPLVSILIASYNKEKYVKRCIESCLNQTYSNIEIIFVDDGSSDNSYETAQKFQKVKAYKKKRKKFNSKFNTYFQIDTYLYAFKKSKGKILTCLDADDFFKKNKINAIVKKFNKDNKANILFDKPIIYYSKNNYFFSNNFKNTRERKIWPKFPPTSCISIKRNLFSKIKNELKLKKFPLLTIDFRLAVISKILFNNFKIINNHLTFYFQDRKGESSSNFRKFGKNWWLRRMQAHEYMIYLYKKNKTRYQNIDYSITKIINLFI